MIEKITYPDGSIEFMETLNGNRYLHNDKGPAVINANGDKHWYYKGHRHRDKGPAIVKANGDKEWYVNGEFFGRMRLPKTS